VTAASELEAAIVAGAIAALRRRASVQAQKARDGTTSAGDAHPHVVIATGEAATAVALARALERIAAEFDAESAL
jgi:hypothetical protein